MAIYKDYGQNKTTDVKTAEELLKEKRITPETAHRNYAYVYRVVCEVIGEAQKEAYNQALEDAAENVEVGCNAVLNPGSMVGASSRVYPLSSVRRTVPAHSIHKQDGQIVPLIYDRD